NTAALVGTVNDDGLPGNAPLEIRWSQVSGPGTTSFTNPNSASTSASFSAPGTYVLRLSAFDSDLLAQSDVTITVNGENHAPTVNAGPDQSITLPAAVSLSGTVTDDNLPEGSAPSVAWSKVSGPGVVNFANANQSFTTASFSSPGTYVLRLTANDSQLTASDDLTITVNQENQAPTVNAGLDQKINLPNTATLNGSVTDDGKPIGSTLNHVWSKVNGPGTVVFSNPNQSVTTASFSTAGTYILRLTATDSQQSNFDEVIVIASPANQAPLVNAGTNQTITLPAPAILNAIVTDDGFPSGNAITINWSKISGPGTVSFSNPNSNVTIANFGAIGTYTLRLTANDGALTSSDDLVVTVNTCPSPSGLNAWWPAEGNFNDYIGSNQGAQLGGTTFLSGNVGQSFSFDGVDDAVTVPDAATIKPEYITLEAWVKFDSLDSVTSDAGL
ncbi:MAG TPA: hypothetical protein VEF04_09365, partial [Blastocatellia bacterium]|nr:hypothetical protein [Blastocatellia bacterium]